VKSTVRSVGHAKALTAWRRGSMGARERWGADSPHLRWAIAKSSALGGIPECTFDRSTSSLDGCEFAELTATVKEE
jgi:hypothetical protein